MSLLAVQATPVSAAASSTLNFQGRLLTNSGGLVTDGSYNIEFKLYSAATIDGGETLVQSSCQTNPGPIADEDCLWVETRSGANTVTVNNGYFSAYLGSVTSFPSTINWDQELWVGMNVGGTGAPAWDGEMSPRFKLTAVPYAFRAGAVTNSAGNAFTGDNLVQTTPGTIQALNAAVAAIRLNQAGTGSLLQLQGNGSDMFTVDKAGNTVAFGTLDVKGASVNVGTTTQVGSLILSDGSSNTVTLTANGVTSSYGLTLPAGAGSVGQCLKTDAVTPTLLVFDSCAVGSGITALNGLGATTQTFATGTTGTDFNISSVGSIHTFNIPDASAANRGLVTIGAQTLAGAKTFSSLLTGGGGASFGANLTVTTGGITVTGNSTLATTAGNTLGLGNATGVLTVTGDVSSTFNINGVVVDAAEFNRLDGKNAALLDVNDAVSVAITGTGALASGSIVSGFGTISTANTITGTTINGTTGINTGAVAGTQRIDSSGNLVNIGTITSGLVNGQTISSSANFDGSLTVATTTTLNGALVVSGAGSLAVKKGTDYSTAGASNSASFTGSVIRLTGISTQTINGITGTSDGRIITLVNAAAQAAVISNQSGSAPTITERIITGTGADISLIPDASIDLSYDITTQRWRVIGGLGGTLVTNVGSIAGSNVNGAVISGNTLNLTIANGTNGGVLTATDQTIGGLKTFSSGLTITSGQNLTFNADVITDLTGTGLTLSGTSLVVNYGSGAGTAVQGNTALTCASGSGNLSGGGNTITLGSGGSCSAISITNAPTFTTSVTSPSFIGTGAVSLSSGGVGDLTLTSGSGVTVFGNTTMRRAGGLTFELNNIANTTYTITNTDVTAVANLLVEGSITGASLSGVGTSLTALNATNITSGTIGDAYLSANVIVKSGLQTLTGLKTFDAGLTITTGQNFTVNGDVFTDLTGSGLVLSGATLTVDATSATGFIRNGGNTLGGLMTIGTSDSNGVSFITAGSNKLSILSGGNVGINNSNPGNRLNINTPTTAVAATEAVISSTSATNKGLVIQGATSQSALLLALQSSTGTQLSGFNSSGGLVLGLTTLSSTATLARSIDLPDAAGTICLSNTDACGFVRLASGTIQTDATANNTIDINKTNATGNLILLKKSGGAVFTVANTGALQIQDTSSTALDIRNVGGTSYFSVDTSSGTVRIGPSVADANGVLFVLDTKNTTGNPTGINGGSYYNSADKKSKCFENDMWTQCSGWQYLGKSTWVSGNTMPPLSIPPRKHLQIRFLIGGYDSNGIGRIRFGTGGVIDTGTNYATSLVQGATLNITSTSTAGMPVAVTGVRTGRYIWMDVYNDASYVKRTNGLGTTTSNSAATIPVQSQIAGLWANTTGTIDIIDSISCTTITGGCTASNYNNDYGITEFQVWGRDDD